MPRAIVVPERLAARLNEQARRQRTSLESLVVTILGAAVEPDAAASTVTDAEWSPKKNARRCRLVDREIDGVITVAERKELKQLQSEMSRYRQSVAPLPIAELRNIHARLMEQAAKRE